MATKKRLLHTHPTQIKVAQVIKLMSELGLKVEVANNPSQGMVIIDGDTTVQIKEEAGNACFEFPPMMEYHLIISDQHGNPKEF